MASSQMTAAVYFHESDVRRILERMEVASFVGSGDSVAIKLHMGEEGCKTYLKPPLVKQVVEYLRELGAKPFLVDSPTLYPRKRQTASSYARVAHAHGFADESIGAEVVIGGGELGEDHVEVAIDNSLELDRIQVIPEIAQADAMIVMTHVTGHIMAIYAGALKQLGMGCVARRTKVDVHGPTRPTHDETLCKRCRSCVEACPFGQVSISGGVVIGRLCTGCGRCLKACPTGALRRKPRFLKGFYRRLADAARGVLVALKWRAGFLNFLVDIFEFCDCSLEHGARLSSDIGILGIPTLPLPIEKASIDLVRKRNPAAFLGIDEYLQALTKAGLGNLLYEIRKA